MEYNEKQKKDSNEQHGKLFDRTKESEGKRATAASNVSGQFGTTDEQKKNCLNADQSLGTVPKIVVWLNEIIVRVYLEHNERVRVKQSKLYF